MLRSAAKINGYAIKASDGLLGDVSDFLFDDATWSVRWLVVDTGNWLSGRKVLLPPTVLGRVDQSAKEFQVKLTKQQVRDSPDIETQRPVSRQMETNIYDYYGWSPYWGNGAFTNANGYVGGSAMAAPPFPGFPPREGRRADGPRDDDDPHLRSIEAVTGCRIHATDGEIGHIEDFLVDDSDWRIGFFIVDTKNWWPGKKVLISPRAAEEIDWNENRLNLNVDRQTVKDSPAYVPSMTIDPAYEKRIHNHYGYGDVRADARVYPSGDAGNFG